MAITPESKVNEKLYHAALLLNLVSDNAAEEVALVAKKSALQGAVAATLHAAFGHFIEEVAYSCQVDIEAFTLDQLTMALQAEERSHAVVATLVQLQSSRDSWLIQMFTAYDQFSEGGGQRGALKPVDPNQIALFQVDQEINLKICLDGFKAFVAENRAYLSEW